jgi:hypothetical protein
MIPYFHDFMQRAQDQRPIGVLPVGTKAIILSLHFKCALIVQIESQTGSHTTGRILYPLTEEQKMSMKFEQFDRDKTALALPLTLSEYANYIALGRSIQ